MSKYFVVWTIFLNSCSLAINGTLNIARIGEYLYKDAARLIEIYDQTKIIAYRVKRED